MKDNFDVVWARKEEETARTSINDEELSLLQKKDVSTLLDLGCGDGTNAQTLTKKGFKVTGLDISQEGLRIAQEKSNATFLFHDIFTTLPFPNESFDAVLAYQSLNHAEKPKILTAFKEVSRVLKKDGLFLIRIANREGFNLTKKGEDTYYDEDYKVTFKEIQPQTFLGLDGDEKGMTLYAYYPEELKKDLERFLSQHEI